MNTVTVKRVLGVSVAAVPTKAQLQALATSATQPPHIRNSAKELLRGRRYAPLSTYQNPQPLQ